MREARRSEAGRSVLNSTSTPASSTRLGPTQPSQDRRDCKANDRIVWDPSSAVVALYSNKPRDSFWRNASLSQFFRNMPTLRGSLLPPDAGFQRDEKVSLTGETLPAGKRRRIFFSGCQRGQRVRPEHRVRTIAERPRTSSRSSGRNGRNTMARRDRTTSNA